MIDWTSRYIGIPYLAHGRTHAGVDCWGLVLLVYREQFDWKLPDFDYQYPAGVLDLFRPLVPASRIDIPEIGCIALLRQPGGPQHVGVYVGESRVLHAPDPDAVVAQRIGHRLSVHSYWRPQ